MEIFNINGWEMIVVVIAFLLLFVGLGRERLPQFDQARAPVEVRACTGIRKKPPRRVFSLGPSPGSGSTRSSNGRTTGVRMPSAKAPVARARAPAVTGASSDVPVRTTSR